jgi:hypothetical protein
VQVVRRSAQRRRILQTTTEYLLQELRHHNRTTERLAAVNVTFLSGTTIETTTTAKIETLYENKKQKKTKIKT